MEEKEEKVRLPVLLGGWDIAVACGPVSLTSVKCANPGRSCGSLRYPTLTSTAAADLSVSGSLIRKASRPFSSRRSRYWTSFSTWRGLTMDSVSSTKHLAPSTSLTSTTPSSIAPLRPSAFGAISPRGLLTIRAASRSLSPQKKKCKKKESSSRRDRDQTNSMGVGGEDEQKMVGPSPSKKMRRADPGLRGANGKASALEFNILARQGRARASVLRLPHYDCRTPMFMPVGTNGSVKGLTPQQLREVRLRYRSGCHRSQCAMLTFFSFPFPPKKYKH